MDKLTIPSAGTMHYHETSLAVNEHLPCTRGRRGDAAGGRLKPRLKGRWPQNPPARVAPESAVHCSRSPLVGKTASGPGSSRPEHTRFPARQYAGRRMSRLALSLRPALLYTMRPGFAPQQKRVVAAKSVTLRRMKWRASLASFRLRVLGCSALWYSSVWWGAWRSAPSRKVRGELDNDVRTATIR